MSKLKTTIRVPEEYKPLLEDLRELTKDGENPNYMTKRAREGLWKSMQKYGWIYPILVDKKGMLGDGEQRLETCLAHEEYYGPVLRLDVDDVDRRLLRQVTNKLRGAHDPDKDLLEYRRLIEGGRRKELISILQLNEKAIKDALEGKIKEDTYRIPPLEEVVTDIELGDLYQVGPHRIICGDSTKEEHFTALMQSEKADMVFTDPPYGVDFEQGKYTGKKPQKIFPSIIGDDKKGIELYRFINECMKNTVEHIKEGTPIYVCSPPLTPSLAFLFGLIDAGVHIQSQIVWDKTRFIIGKADYHWQHEIIWYGYYGKKHRWHGPRNEKTVWSIKRDHYNNILHPTMKPVELCARAIGNSSLPGDIVLDPFAGSGSTLIACEQLDRKGYMIELDPRYCQIIIDRWEAYTGETAEKM